ncbi:MAG: hypothetical protein LIP03_09020 [Bacteroidales bacterium]|nr:hypothetical protein [Bacteroidales bacterium]
METKDQIPLTREEALRRWEDSKRKKRELVATAVEELKKEFRAETGEDPKYIEVW